LLGGSLELLGWALDPSYPLAAPPASPLSRFARRAKGAGRGPSPTPGFRADLRSVVCACSSVCSGEPNTEHHHRHRPGPSLSPAFVYSRQSLSSIRCSSPQLFFPWHGGQLESSAQRLFSMARRPASALARAQLPGFRRAQATLTSCPIRGWVHSLSSDERLAPPRVRSLFLMPPHLLLGFSIHFGMLQALCFLD